MKMFDIGLADFIQVMEVFLGGVKHPKRMKYTRVIVDDGTRPGN